MKISPGFEREKKKEFLWFEKKGILGATLNCWH